MCFSPSKLPTTANTLAIREKAIPTKMESEEPIGSASGEVRKRNWKTAQTIDIIMIHWRLVYLTPIMEVESRAVSKILN